ncbi:hypothetical protein [Nonomuraea sp. NPDC049400]|uniref:hypothetical protein n=1 Tax=Nonomuraea sp. NPDC049400 TaxID=3364352 RepID=UPI0037A01FBF
MRGFLGAHVDVDAATVDLADAKRYQLLRCGEQGRIMYDLARGQDMLQELRDRAAKKVETGVHTVLLVVSAVHPTDDTARPDVTAN